MGNAANKFSPGVRACAVRRVLDHEGEPRRSSQRWRRDLTKTASGNPGRSTCSIRRWPTACGAARWSWRFSGRSCQGGNDLCRSAAALSSPDRRWGYNQYNGHEKDRRHSLGGDFRAGTISRL